MDLTVGIGLLGCGTVGSAVAERLAARDSSFRERAGARYELRAIGVRNANKVRSPALDPALFTTDVRALVEDRRIDVIVECIGGTGIAVELIETAMDRGCPVVTANKNALGTQGPRLRALAALRRVPLLCEAAVCAGIPLLGAVAALASSGGVAAVAGILNGTTNFMLDEMEGGASYDEALADAQRRGFAEADPSSDVDGWDAAHKLAVLVQCAFGAAVISPRIPVEGISRVTQRDIARATMLGYRIRLLAGAKDVNGAIAAQVAPVLVPRDHPFASAKGVDNAIAVSAPDAGTIRFTGAGAGGSTTASAILSDVAAALRGIAERHDLTRTRRALLPVSRVDRAFDDLRRLPELPRLRVWDDAAMLHPRHAPASRKHFAFSSPGKEPS